MKWLVGIIIGLTLVFVGLGIYRTMNNGLVTAEGNNIQIGNKKDWDKVLTEVGWGKSGNCKLLSGENISCEKLKKLELIYTDMEQIFLRQTLDGTGSAFAAVGESVVDDKLILSVFVEPTKFNDGSDKGWWIAHQAIWALDMIFEPEVEIYQNMFAKYQNSNLLIVK